MRVFLPLSLVLTLVLGVLPAAAQPHHEAPRLLDLPTLVAQARANNPSLRAARLEAEALAHRPAQVSALPDPEVMVSYRPLAVSDFTGVVPAQVMARQAIPYPGKRALADAAARLEAEAASADADAIALELEYEVKEAYFSLMRVQEHLHHIGEFAERLGDFEEVAAVRYEVGQGPQQAILKAQVERLALQRRLLDLVAARREHLERLARLTDDPRLAAVQEVHLAPPPLDRPSDAARTRALALRPEAKALRLRQKQVDTEVALAKKAFKPDFTVGVGFMDMMRMGRAVQPLGDLPVRFALQAGLTLPLNRTSREAALQEARLRGEQVQARFEALENEVRADIDVLLARLDEEMKALRLYDEALLPQAETTVASTLSAYTTGQAPFPDLLDAERMRFELQMGRADTFARALQTRAALDRALGLTTIPAEGVASLLD